MELYFLHIIGKTCSVVNIPLRPGILSYDFINKQFELVYIEVKILKRFYKESCKSRSIEMLEFLISFRDELQLL